MANLVYTIFKSGVLDGHYDLLNSGLFLALVNDGFKTDNSTLSGVQYYGQLTGTALGNRSYTGEAHGTAYIRGGQKVTGKAITGEHGADMGVFDAADVTWASSTITASGAVLYQSGQNFKQMSTWPVICYFDFGSNQSSSAGDFTVSFNSAGILALSGSAG